MAIVDLSKRVKNLAYMVSPAAISKAETGAQRDPALGAGQKRWPMAMSILGAVAVSLAMWVGIGWMVLAILGLFS